MFDGTFYLLPFFIRFTVKLSFFNCPQLLIYLFDNFTTTYDADNTSFRFYRGYACPSNYHRIYTLTGVQCKSTSRAYSIGALLLVPDSFSLAIWHN